MTDHIKMIDTSSGWAQFGSTIGTRLLLTTACHPFDYAKTLIQVNLLTLTLAPLGYSSSFM